MRSEAEHESEDNLQGPVQACHVCGTAGTHTALGGSSTSTGLRFADQVPWLECDEQNSREVRLTISSGE